MNRQAAAPRLLAWDVWRAARGGAPALAARQERRLAGLVGYARRHSPYYRQLYQGLPEQNAALHELPPVAKPELMAHFDAWVADPVVERAGVQAFVAEPERVGQQHLGQYAVWTTSGTTGTPGLFVHDGPFFARELIEQRQEG